MIFDKNVSTKKDTVFSYAALFILVLLASSCNYFRPRIAQPLTGEQTTKLIASFYNELGPRIGSHLVEPNVVLTIAGERGHGNFLMHNLSNEEKQAFENINAKSEKKGIRFIVDDDVKDDIVDITILNLNGYENTSKISKFPFIQPFDSSKGFDRLETLVKRNS